MGATTYIVLVKDGDKHWREIGPQTAGSPRQAITAALESGEAGSTTGTFATVPQQSWNPVPVAPRTAFTFGSGD